MANNEDLKKIVGSKNVLDDEETLEEYSRDISFVPPVRPRCVVKPKDAAEVQKLVKWANERLSPLVPVSSGAPHFRGDTIPGIGGAVIVDLSGMKKVIRVDRFHRVAMVEPGVTFGELIPAVAKEGLRLNLPLLPRKSKSVIGSMLEREPVIMPKYHWDISDPLACVEVIFGNGEMFRTGAAAGPGTIEEQWAAGGAQKTPYGPGPAAWYRLIQGAQGTMGIVTWASLRCELLPSVEEPFLVGSSQLDRIMELAHWLIRLRLPNECFILNSTDLATIMAKAQLEAYAKMKQALPEWILFFNVAGYDYFPEDRVKGQVLDIKELSQRFGLEPVVSLGGVSAFELLKTVQAPSKEFYWKQPGGWNCQEIFFISNFQKVSELIKTMYDIADGAGYNTSNMGVYIQPIVQGVNYHVEFDMFYPPQNKVELEFVRKLSIDAVRQLIDKGAFFSRPYGEATPIIMNRDAATVTALKKIKMILDPDNIMNPGKLCF